MPHLSHNTISDKKKKELENRMVSLLSTTSTRTRKRVLAELLTRTEKLMMAKRLTLIYLVSKDIPTHTISRTLKMSSSTVAHFEQKIERGMYKKTIIWLKQHDIENKFFELVGDLLTIPFNDKGKPMGIGRFIDEKL